MLPSKISHSIFHMNIQHHYKDRQDVVLVILHILYDHGHCTKANQSHSICLNLEATSNKPSFSNASLNNTKSMVGEPIESYYPRACNYKDVSIVACFIYVLKCYSKKEIFKC